MSHRMLSVEEFFGLPDEEPVRSRKTEPKGPTRPGKFHALEIALVMKAEKVARKEALAILKKRLAD